jgi:hypothetical protein
MSFTLPEPAEKLLGENRVTLPTGNAIAVLPAHDPKGEE